MWNEKSQLAQIRALLHRPEPKRQIRRMCGSNRCRDARLAFGPTEENELVRCGGGVCLPESNVREVCLWCTVRRLSGRPSSGPLRRPPRMNGVALARLGKMPRPPPFCRELLCTCTQYGVKYIQVLYGVVVLV